MRRSKALGVKCNLCHEKDFKAPTPKKIATDMWNDFTASSRSTVAGRSIATRATVAGPVPRSTRLGPSGWMQANYVNAEARGQKETTCDMCHGDPFEGNFLQA